VSEAERKQREELRGGVRRRKRSLEERERSPERSLAENLALYGSLGWIVVTPTLLGTWLGRRLDRSFESGLVWTGGLLFLGLVLGCWMAWRRVHEA